MLTKGNSGYNLAIFKFCCISSFFPLKFDSNGHLRVEQRTLKIVLHRAWSLITIIYSIFMLVRLIEITQRELSEWIKTLPTHLILAMTGLVGSMWNFEFCCQMPHLNVIIFNDISDTLFVPGVKRHDRRSLRWLLRAAPFVFVVFPTTILSVYAEDPEAPHTIYSALPQEYKSSETILLCALVEYVLQVFLIAQYFLGGFTMIVFIQMAEKELQDGLRAMRSLRNPTLSAMRIHVERCRLMQLRIALFNKMFENSIYALKLEIMVDVVVGFFFAVKLFEISPTLAISSFYVAIQDFVMYNLMFQKACNIPSKMNEYKTEIQRVMARCSKEDRDEVKRYYESVRVSGISQGGFHCFERTSNAEFSDFCLQTTISLLLSYPEPFKV